MAFLNRVVATPMSCPCMAHFLEALYGPLEPRGSSPIVLTWGGYFLEAYCALEPHGGDPNGPTRDGSLPGNVIWPSWTAWRRPLSHFLDAFYGPLEPRGGGPIVLITYIGWLTSWKRYKALLNGVAAAQLPLYGVAHFLEALYGPLEPRGGGPIVLMWGGWTMAPGNLAAAGRNCDCSATACVPKGTAGWAWTAMGWAATTWWRG